MTITKLRIRDIQGTLGGLVETLDDAFSNSLTYAETVARVENILTKVQMFNNKSTKQSLRIGNPTPTMKDAFDLMFSQPSTRVNVPANLLAFWNTWWSTEASVFGYVPPQMQTTFSTLWSSSIGTRITLSDGSKLIKNSDTLATFYDIYGDTTAISPSTSLIELGVNDTFLSSMSNEYTGYNIKVVYGTYTSNVDQLALSTFISVLNSALIGSKIRMNDGSFFVKDTSTQYTLYTVSNNISATCAIDSDFASLLLVNSCFEQGFRSTYQVSLELDLVQVSEVMPTVTMVFNEYGNTIVTSAENTYEIIKGSSIVQSARRIPELANAWSVKYGLDLDDIASTWDLGNGRSIVKQLDGSLLYSGGGQIIPIYRDSNFVSLCAASSDLTNYLYSTYHYVPTWYNVRTTTPMFTTWWTALVPSPAVPVGTTYVSDSKTWTKVSATSIKFEGVGESHTFTIGTDPLIQAMTMVGIKEEFENVFELSFDIYLQQETDSIDVPVLAIAHTHIVDVSKDKPFLIQVLNTYETDVAIIQLEGCDRVEAYYVGMEDADLSTLNDPLWCKNLYRRNLKTISLKLPSTLRSGYYQFLVEFATTRRIISVYVTGTTYDASGSNVPVEMLGAVLTPGSISGLGSSIYSVNDDIEALVENLKFMVAQTYTDIMGKSIERPNILMYKYDSENKASLGIQEGGLSVVSTAGSNLNLAVDGIGEGSVHLSIIAYDIESGRYYAPSTYGDTPHFYSPTIVVPRGTDKCNIVFPVQGRAGTVLTIRAVNGLVYTNEVQVSI